MYRGSYVLSRGEFLKAGAAATVTLAFAANAAVGQENDKMDGLKSEFLFKLVADLDPPRQVGDTPDGARIIYNVTGGTIDGPRIKGKILPGGGDWFRVRSDGTGELDVRATIQTGDNVLIYMRYTGVTHTKAEDGSRYFRTTPRFETASEKYAWLNDVVAVGVGQTGDNQVSYDVYEIL